VITKKDFIRFLEPNIVIIDKEKDTKAAEAIIITVVIIVTTVIDAMDVVVMVVTDDITTIGAVKITTTIENSGKTISSLVKTEPKQPIINAKTTSLKMKEKILSEMPSLEKIHLEMPNQEKIHLVMPNQEKKSRDKSRPLQKTAHLVMPNQKMIYMETLSQEN
jgi:hypothetical protein